MAWPLLEVIDGTLDQPWCRTLATHLGHFEQGGEKELRHGRRYAVARRLAGLRSSAESTPTRRTFVTLKPLGKGPIPTDEVPVDLPVVWREPNPA